MDFKPTLWKIIVSIIISTYLLFTGLLMYFFNPCRGVIDVIRESPGDCIISPILYVIVWLISIAIVYTIWSLIQKKK